MELISRCRYTVAVGPNIITKEEITESDSVLVYTHIIDYRAHIFRERERDRERERQGERERDRERERERGGETEHICSPCFN